MACAAADAGDGCRAGRLTRPDALLFFRWIWLHLNSYRETVASKWTFRALLHRQTVASAHPCHRETLLSGA